MSDFVPKADTGRSFGSLRTLVFRPVDRLSDKALSLVSVAPAGGRYPLASFEVLVVREEVLDLAPRDFREIGIIPDFCVALRELWNRAQRQSSRRRLPRPPS